ncbi:hypothetical protein LTR97_004551 [Elasticomyces elasticus]|uniref:Uncharacterized protein n=1 Tax=Elasticomyces elasticus TaxID=574655 RepID=A0AAN7VTP3_9PEZI|nr:hypothetical protein LTR97_004551 [Elasticomyces elasticus]
MFSLNPPASLTKSDFSTIALGDLEYTQQSVLSNASNNPTLTESDSPTITSKDLEYTQESVKSNASNSTRSSCARASSRPRQQRLSRTTNVYRHRERFLSTIASRDLEHNAAKYTKHRVKLDPQLAFHARAPILTNADRDTLAETNVYRQEV